MPSGREPNTPPAGEPSATFAIVAGLGLVALAAAIVIAVTASIGWRDDVERAEAAIAAERQAGIIALQVQQLETAVERTVPSCVQDPPAAGSPVSCTTIDRIADAELRTLLEDPAARVAQAQARDREMAVLSAPVQAGPELIIGPVYEPEPGRYARQPSEPTVTARRDEIAGYIVAEVDAAALLAASAGQWRIEDAGSVLGGVEVLDGDTVDADVNVLERRWTVSTAVQDPGLWRPVPISVAGFGALAAVLLGLADRRRRQLVSERTTVARRAEQRASAVRTLAGVVQQSQDPSEILPAMAVQLSDELGLAGIALSVQSAAGGEREVFVHGTAPDRSVVPRGRRPATIAPGETLAIDLHRAERTIALLRVRAGDPLDADAIDLLDLAGEMITSVIVSTRSLEQQQEAVSRLEALDELKTSFLGVASHELRTPATAISGLASLLADRWDALGDQDRRVFAQRIATNADALNGLVQDLLDFARLERGDFQLALAPVDLSATVEAVLGRLDTVWGSHGIEQRIEPGASVLGDVTAIERIVTNLVSNAVKFSPDGSPVTVCVEREDHRVRLVVDDEGPGVPDHERDKIFVRFYRGAGDAVVRTRGVGIGLSVVQDFVAQMGGAVRVEGSPAGGARFVVELAEHDRSRDEVPDVAST